MERSSSHSRTRRPSSRPTTPLRPSSRSSIRDAHGAPGTLSSTPSNPAEIFEPAFAELSDSMADLEANMMHLQLMHESLSRFSESFASFLYGLNMNAFCVDFPEAPVSDSFKRERQGAYTPAHHRQPAFDGETTFMTSDTSFVEHPTTITKPAAAAPKTEDPVTPAPKRNVSGTSTRGGSGIARGSYRGARGSRGSGIARGRGASRGVR